MGALVEERNSHSPPVMEKLTGLQHIILVHINYGIVFVLPAANGLAMVEHPHTNPWTIGECMRAHMFQPIFLQTQPNPTDIKIHLHPSNPDPILNPTQKKTHFRPTHLAGLAISTPHVTVAEEAPTSASHGDLVSAKASAAARDGWYGLAMVLVNAAKVARVKGWVRACCRIGVVASSNLAPSTRSSPDAEGRRWWWWRICGGGQLGSIW